MFIFAEYLMSMEQLKLNSAIEKKDRLFIFLFQMERLLF